MRRSYVIDAGPHEGHTATVVAAGMPSVRFDKMVGEWDTWVECECGEAWAFVPAEADEEAKDGDGWPE